MCDVADRRCRYPATADAVSSRRKPIAGFVGFL
jgi:hypothetical protein